MVIIGPKNIDGGPNKFFTYRVYIAIVLLVIE